MPILQLIQLQWLAALLKEWKLPSFPLRESCKTTYNHTHNVIIIMLIIILAIQSGTDMECCFSGDLCSGGSTENEVINSYQRYLHL